MRLLLDTNALLWFLMTPEVLRRDTYAAIIDTTNVASVSVASIWEAAIKASTGKLTLPMHFVRAIDDSGFSVLGITTTHAMKVVDLPRHHRDPFDRILVAQAIVEDMTLVTRDATLPLYNVPILAA